MWTRVLLYASIFLFGFSVHAQQGQNVKNQSVPNSSQGAQNSGQKPLPSTGAKIPPEALKLVNPIKPTATSIAIGKKKYRYDCAMCHGVDGDGKGDLAIDMKLNMIDYRDPETLKSVTDSEMFWVIKNGNGTMPSEADRLKDDDIWNMVNYIRSIPTNKPPETEEKPKSEKP